MLIANYFFFTGLDKFFIFFHFVGIGLDKNVKRGILRLVEYLY